MRILLVEDEPRIAADIGATLRAAGYVVETVGDGEDAWFRGDTEDYDLIVLDLGLPKMDGLAVLKRWRAAGRNMPVRGCCRSGAGSRAGRAAEACRRSSSRLLPIRTR